jgi:high-affinity nickel permease
MQIVSGISISILALGFSLGFVHAMDADHVMAVSALSNRHHDNGKKRGIAANLALTLRHCSHWALGHGAVLLLSAGVVFGLGLSLPASLGHFAELAVGVVLIAIGGSLLWQLRRERVVMLRHKHQHEHGELEHVHLVKNSTVNDACPNSANPKKRALKHSAMPAAKAHAPVMVGALHGLAGSAPALALVPVINDMALLSALLYVLVFSCSVLLGMVVFGLGLGSVQSYLTQRHSHLFDLFRQTLGAATVVFGAVWFVQAL